MLSVLTRTVLDAHRDAILFSPHHLSQPTAIKRTSSANSSGASCGRSSTETDPRIALQEARRYSISKKGRSRCDAPVNIHDRSTWKPPLISNTQFSRMGQAYNSVFSLVWPVRVVYGCRYDVKAQDTLGRQGRMFLALCHTGDTRE
jgi:hypothetical protein